MDIMYNNHMNDDQQNTDQQPPVPQSTPSQPPQTTKQQLQVNQIYNQHDDAVERDLVYTNEHDLNVHIARSFAIMILGLFLLIVIGSATGLLSKHYGVFVLVNIIHTIFWHCIIRDEKHTDWSCEINARCESLDVLW